MTENASPTLAARLLAVMGEVGYIQKEGKTQSGPSFKYVRHDDVVAALRPALVKHGVAFMSGIDETSVGCEQVGTTKSGAARYKTTLVLRLTFVNADNPEEAYSVSFPGEGVDTDDKGSGKALSYALKNGLLKMFLIESGDEADVELAGPPAVNTATRGDQQREQAAAPAPNGNGGERPPITRTQAEQLHAAIFSKGRTDAAVLTILGEHGIGDGARFGSIPADKFAHVLAQLSKLADPPPPEPSAPAAAPVPAESVSADDFTQPVTSTREPPAEAPALAAAPTTTEPETVERPNGCTLDNSYQQCAAIKAGTEPPCASCNKYDQEFVPLDAATRPDAEPEPKRKKGSLTTGDTGFGGQLGRVIKQCVELEGLGVGRDEWRYWMAEKFGVAHRDELMKTTTAPKCIDALQRWIDDVKSGVRGPGEKAVA